MNQERGTLHVAHVLLNYMRVFLWRRAMRFLVFPMACTALAEAHSLLIWTSSTAAALKYALGYNSLTLQAWEAGVKLLCKL